MIERNHSTDPSPAEDHPSPAHRVMEIFGGARPTARVINEELARRGKGPIDVTTPWKWLKRGRVPQDWHYLLIALAAKHGAKLTYEDLAYREE